MSFARGGSSPPIRTNLELILYFVYDIEILMQSSLVCRVLSFFVEAFLMVFLFRYPHQFVLSVKCQD